MPQLNLETYVTQYFWFLVILFVFYLFVYVLVLPKISETFKLRKKLSTNNSEFSNVFVESEVEKKNVSSSKINSFELKQSVTDLNQISNSIVSKVELNFKNTLKNKL